MFRRTYLPLEGRVPPAIQTANVVLELAPDIARRPLDADRLIRTARRNTGLSDFGPGDVREPLARLVESVETEAKLHPLGRVITRTRMLGVLENRLRCEYWIGKHPEILDKEIRSPIVITGLQRTGTTLLQRLLGADPDHRALRSWEGLHPAPLPGEVNGRDGTILPHAGKRIRSARRAARSLRLLAPSFYMIHPVEHLGPEEEVLLLDHSLISTVPEALLYVPSFSKWVESCDQSIAYGRLERILKLLQWRRPDRRWVLKSPHHLEWPEYLFAQFPGARVIMTHRDPGVATNSFFSMVWHSNRIFSRHTTASDLAQHWLRKTRRMIKKTMDYRKEHGSDRFIDLSYYDLTSDPPAALETLYARLGLRFSDDRRRRVRRVLAHHRKNRYGVHHYSRAAFALDPTVWRQAFAEYRAAFDIPHERRG